jgi:hypothetical protein
MARLVVADGHNTGTALSHAARELGVNLPRQLPEAARIRAAIEEYRMLFAPEQAATLNHQRQLALQAMQALVAFHPLLFGSLVDGMGALDRIRLLLTADSAEQVMMALTDQHIPWRDSETPLSYSRGRRKTLPCLRFRAGNADVELVITSAADRSDPPFDPLSGGKLPMLDAAAVQRLIAP